MRTLTIACLIWHGIDIISFSASEFSRFIGFLTGFELKKTLYGGKLSNRIMSKNRFQNAKLDYMKLQVYGGENNSNSH
jgi:hypothetical protein